MEAPAGAVDAARAAAAAVVQVATPDAARVADVVPVADADQVVATGGDVDRDVRKKIQVSLSAW